MTLPAIETLNTLGAPHEVRRFDPALDAAAAAQALGLPPAAVLKTLAVASMQGVTLCCLGCDRQLDLERLGDSRSALVGRDALPRMTGFAAGAVTPIAGPGGRRFPVLLDEAALTHPIVGIGAGEAGVELLLSPAELVRATGAKVQALTLA
jgi:Cys-tRNA(Pro)/Cys-tRNA(Cys) deacylase